VLVYPLFWKAVLKDKIKEVDAKIEAKLKAAKSD